MNELHPTEVFLLGWRADCIRNAYCGSRNFSLDQSQWCVSLAFAKLLRQVMTLILALVCCAFLCSEGARHNLQSFEVLPPFAKMVNGITTDFMHQEVEKHCSPMCGPEALKPFQNLAKVRDTVRNLQLQALLEPCAPQLGQLADSLSAHLGQMAHLHRAAVRNSIEALRVHYMTFQKWKHKDWFVWWWLNPFSRMRSEGFPFIVGVWGWTCVRVALVG